MPRQLHPESVLEQEVPRWQRLWTAAQDLDVRVSQVQSLLSELPAVDSVPCAFHFTVEALQRSMRKMVDKAPGPDGFAASQLLALPRCWWAAFARLWQHILDCGEVPAIWRRSSVSLLAKPVSGFRPIGLTALAWRCGARLLSFGLKPWVSAWAADQGFGGIHERSCSDVHRRVHYALRQGTSSFIQEDISKFFDSVHLPLARLVLEHFQMPSAVIRLLCSFYDGQERLLRYRGFCARSWVRASCGLVQGCPLCPLIGSAVMAVGLVSSKDLRFLV